MKRFLTLFCGFIVCLAQLHLTAQMTQKELLAPISEVKLHLSGAEVGSKVSLVLQPGRNHFLIPDLSSKIYPQTIQVACSHDYVSIVSVTCKTNFLRKSKEDQRITSLKDSVDWVKRKIMGYNDEKGAFDEEREMLRQNRQFKGDDKTLTVAELKTTADFYRARMEEINKNLSRLALLLEESHRKLFDLKLQLTELNSGLQPTAEIHLVLEVPRAVTTDLELHYVVADAGWSAIYDLKSLNLNDSTIHLKYKASAVNNTGIDWNNLKLSLCTADPLQTATRPKLNVWNLSEYSLEEQLAGVNNQEVLQNKINAGEYAAQRKGRSVDDWNRVISDQNQRLTETQRILGEDFDAKVDYDTDLYRRYQAERINAPIMSQGYLDIPDLNSEFLIATPYTIPADKKPYIVDIDSFTLAATYKYFAVPKMDKDPFLNAQVVGWEDLHLVSGPMNIYQGRKYIGQSMIDIRNLSDTLSLNMGRDKDVVVTCLKVKGKTSNQLLGGTKKWSTGYNISVRNNHDYPITIQVEDQVPISNDKEIIVTVDEMGGATFEDKIGLLTWNMTLQPKETRTVEFGFSVKYPKNRAVSILPQRGTRSLYIDSI